MNAQVLSHQHMVMVITAILVGTIARLISVKEDFRQYPSYPNGYMIQILMGFVASALGAIAIPSLMTKNFIAVTFLTLAVQQFRDVRRAERESLKDLENTEYTYRGNAYIDGVAKTFESRNYFSLVVALATAITMQVIHSKQDWINIAGGAVVGFILLFVLKRFSKGKTIGDIAEVEQGIIEIKDTELFVNGTYVSNLLGLGDAAAYFEKEGLAVVVKPHAKHLQLTLDNFGQRQAALFEATRAIGLKRYHFTRRDFEKDLFIIALVPIVKDIGGLIEAVKKTPLLESSKKSPSVMKTNMVGKK